MFLSDKAVFFQFRTPHFLQFILNTHQCKRNVCKNADKPSIMTRIAMVNTDQAAKVKYKAIGPKFEFKSKPLRRTIVQSTSDSSRKIKRNFKKLIINLVISK